MQRKKSLHRKIASIKRPCSILPVPRETVASAAQSVI